MFRPRIVALVLFASLFAHTFAVSSSPTGGAIELTTRRAPIQEVASGFDSSYKLSLSHPVQDKNFYLLSLLQRSASLRKLLGQNPVLKQLANEKITALKKSASCANVSCFDELMRFDEPAIAAVANELRALTAEPEFKRLVEKDMRPSGVFVRYSQQSDGQVVSAAWKDAAAGLNRILKVYCLGKDPRYPAIDKVSFDVNSPAFVDLLTAKTGEIKIANDPLFFEPALAFAMKLLEVNRRDEAGRYEPLEQGQNKIAVENLKHIKWSDYPYSFILVLGSGPSDSAPISALGARRADVGAQLFLEHKAPLIILSGGHVHPMQTPYCEAIEMKKHIMEKYRIPAANILVEPQARHTTTNFRNAVRLAFRYRIPTDRTALVTSSESHINSSASEDFRTRCVNELGYFPIEFIKRISPVAAEFKPAIASLFFDATDPLDP